MGRRDIKRRLRSPKSDPQRTQVYRMEREIEGNAVGHSSSQSGLDKLSRSVCRYYKVPAVEIWLYNEPKSKLFGWATDEEIHLNEGFHGANAPVLIHELAHYVIFKRFDVYEDHGPEWVAVYMHLMHKYRLLPQDAFRVMAARWGIRIAQEYLPGALKPR